MDRAPRPRRSLLDGLDLDAPHITEIRRILQNLYRMRTGSDSEIRSYMVTSAGRDEGKSTICSLLAIVSARIFYKRTLIIDGDLRRPTVHSLLGISQVPGLFDVMRRNVPLRDAIHPTVLPMLSAVPSGQLRGIVSEAYADEAFVQVLREATASYDLVFVDAPPAVPVVEPQLMAAHVDALLVVAMAGKTALSMVRRFMQIMTSVHGKIAGVVLNNASEGLPYYYDHRYYGYPKPQPSRIRTVHPESREDMEQQPKDIAGGTP
ncbi:MAG TPA: CpsD/CapB family tyrosine-protein kinase [Candidatus Eisenbacteria bacterium]|nr:CpsD/CapB family tyrosine-protein kinase [Candidatus Eisenbacteria bacterium]